MMDGKICAGAKPLGIGFPLADRVLATAAHVVRGKQAVDLEFVAPGVRIRIEKVEVRPELDIAILWLARSVPVVPSLARAVAETNWRVTARPNDYAVQLTGHITAIDHPLTNQWGDEMTVLQLYVRENLRGFKGYSGSPVTVDGDVVGILVEQVLERQGSASITKPPPAANVLYAVPLEQVVRRFRLSILVHTREGRQNLAVHKLLDTAYFDLDRLKTTILGIKSTASGRLLLFGVECSELKVASNLCAWLPMYIGEVAQKTHLTLRPDLTSVEETVRNVTRYAADLHRGVSVVCVVLVSDVPADRIADFCLRVRSAVPDGRSPWLILFLAGIPAGGFPPSVAVLPRPSFEYQDVEFWARQVAAYRRWPAEVAPHWGRNIAEQASDGNQLDIRWTYEVLEDFIQRIRTEPEDLLRHLEDLESPC